MSHSATNEQRQEPQQQEGKDISRAAGHKEFRATPEQKDLASKARYEEQQQWHRDEDEHRTKDPKRNSGERKEGAKPDNLRASGQQELRSSDQKDQSGRTEERQWTRQDREDISAQKNQPKFTEFQEEIRKEGLEEGGAELLTEPGEKVGQTSMLTTEEMQWQKDETQQQNRDRSRDQDFDKSRDGQQKAPKATLQQGIPKASERTEGHGLMKEAVSDAKTASG